MRLIRPVFAARRLLLAGLVQLVSAGELTAQPTNPAAAEPFDFAEPKLITGTIYALGSDRKQVLYAFRRTTVRDGATVRVERKFLCPDGTVAAVENAVYEAGRLVSFEMRELQTGVSGAIQIAPDAQHPGQSKIAIGYAHGPTPPKGDWQKLPSDTLVDDTIYPFLVAHWDELMRGDAVKFHFVALEWKKAFSFRFVKAGEAVVDGRTVERIRMEPTNLLVASVVNPLTFILEKDAPRRIISYVGRTTPRVKKGKSWKYLDAETVFDWK